MSYQPPAKIVNPDTSWTAERLGWLGLAWFDGFGTRTLHRLAARYRQNGHAAWNSRLPELAELHIPEKTAIRFAEFRRQNDPDEFRVRLESEGIRLVLETDPDYPALLKQIADPPFALFARGDFAATVPLVAVVGTRDCTAYGKNVAGQLAGGLAASGLGIVSGLALGVDAFAHQAALEARGYCLAVLGSGCDSQTIYPRHNLQLAHRILEQGGAVISEFPPGTEGLKHHFPLRNRIIAGLSRLVVVVEAAAGSGSLITAHLALEQNRDVFAVPGPITSLQSDGTNKLLKLGAIPCTGVADILEHLALDPPTESDQAPEADLSPQEQEILDLLNQPRLADDICRQLKTDAATVSGRLVALELKGLIKAEGGQTFSRVKRRNSGANMTKKSDNSE